MGETWLRVRADQARVVAARGWPAPVWLRVSASDPTPRRRRPKPAVDEDLTNTESWMDGGPAHQVPWHGWRPR